MEDISVKLREPVQALSTLQILPGSGEIGFGYDVNGNYAQPESILPGCLFDFPDKLKEVSMTVSIGGSSERLTFSLNELFEFHKIGRSEYHEVYGSTIDKYMESLDREIGIEGDYKLFSGSLTKNFSSESLRQEETTYSTIRESHKLWSINLPRSQALRQYLKPEIKADLENKSLSAFAVFDKYGGAYLGEVVVGGRLDSSSATKTLKMNSKTDIKVIAKASYQFLVGELELDRNSERHKEIESFREHSKSKSYGIGGSAAYSSKIFQGDKAARDAWAGSLYTQGALMDFTTDSLRPIWELVEDETRREELKKQFPVWVKKNMTEVKKDKNVLVIDPLPAMKQVGNDKGSGARMSVSVWAPVISDSSEYYYGGQWAQPGHGPTAIGRAIVFKDLLNLGLLKEPVDYLKIWDDAGSKKDKDYSCWRPAPPVGYRALGDFMVLGRSSRSFPEALKKRVMCVHESLCRDVERKDLLGWVWKDAGSGAKRDLSIWRIGPTAGIANFIGSPHESSVPDSVINSMRGVIGILKEEYVDRMSLSK